MNPPRQQVGSIPGLAEQMVPRQLAGRNNTLNLPDQFSTQPRVAPNPYMDHAVMLPGVPFGITPNTITAMDDLRQKTFGFPKGGPDALQHGPMPTELSMGGGPLNYDLAEAGSRLGLNPPARPQPGRNGMDTRRIGRQAR